MDMSDKSFRSRPNIIPLTKVPSGKKIKVINISGGRHRVQKIMDMGLTPGVEAYVRQNRYFGPIIVDVRGVTIAIGRGIAEGILVEVL
jgi:ferrous iron transport protein A